MNVPTEYMGILCRSCKHFIPGERASSHCPRCEPECESGADDREMSIAWETNLCNYWEKKVSENNGSKK